MKGLILYMLLCLLTSFNLYFKYIFKVCLQHLFINIKTHMAGEKFGVWFLRCLLPTPIIIFQERFVGFQKQDLRGLHFVKYSQTKYLILVFDLNCLVKLNINMKRVVFKHGIVFVSKLQLILLRYILQYFSSVKVHRILVSATIQDQSLTRGAGFFEPTTL